MKNKTKIMTLVLAISFLASACCQQEEKAAENQTTEKEKLGYTMKPGTIDDSGDRTW